MSTGGMVNSSPNFGYVAARSKHLSDILFRARLGGLSPDWREHLCSVAAQMGVHGPHADAEARAITDLRSLPLAPWEPRQADWQTSLDSWYVTARKTITEKYANMVRLDMDQLITTDSACVLAGTGRLSTRILKEVARQDSTADTSRRSYLQVYITERTSLTGSYLAGLAAGGVEINWRRWYRNEIGTWPPSHPGRRRCEAEIASRTHERLPVYWTLGRG